MLKIKLAARPKRANPFTPTEPRPAAEDGADAPTVPELNAPTSGVNRSPAGILAVGLSLRLPRALALLCAAVLASATGAHADLITQEQQFANRKTDFTDTTTLVFDRFDTLGNTRSLTSVTIEYDQTLRTQVSIPKPPKGATITVNVGSTTDPLTLTTANPLGLSLDALNPAMTSLVTQLDPITVVWSASEGRAFQQSWSQTSTIARTFSDPQSLALFQGESPFALLSVGDSWSTYRSSTGSGGALVLTNADVRASLRYEYRTNSTNSIVPEPSSLCLGTLGVTSLVWILRRQRARRPKSRIG